jgi:acylphosphatase
MNRCRRFLVTGRVQGVFFRASTQDVARQLGLTGWVRNLYGGNVEVLACGEPAQLDQMESWLKKGPPSAKVESVSSIDVEAKEKEYEGFGIKR